MVLCWICLFLPYGVDIFLFSVGGILSLICNSFLIPSVILYLIFIFINEISTPAAVGFGLGIAGLCTGLVGQIIEFILNVPNFVNFILIGSYITLIILGSLLFARRHMWIEVISLPSQKFPY